MRHHTEVELLELYYLPPGDSMPVMMHVAECDECTARYERLEQKLRRGAQACHARTAAKPDSFWSRQRRGILEAIERGDRPQLSWRRPLLVAAAAILVVALAGVLSNRPGNRSGPEEGAGVVAPPMSANEQAAPTPADDYLPQGLQAMRDPWETDQLKDLHGMVAWESWELESTNAGGGPL
ncbi:MAG TPA: hypothetical protein VMT00_14555 [Thermoanaerobaculia bacterium]|nr:hypothetical protein [Thermoanaerobaculia bacterium]